MRPCPCRLGSRAGGNCRAWNRRGTRQLLIPPPAGFAVPPPLRRSRLRPVGNEVLVIRVAAYVPGGD
jgi:hypothetical protein